MTFTDAYLPVLTHVRIIYFSLRATSICSRVVFSPIKPAAAATKSLQSCPTLFDPRDGSPPGSPIPGILQARTLEWVAISFSNAWKWKVKVKSLSRVRLLATPWTAAHQAPPSMGFSRQEYWSGVPLPSPPVKPSLGQNCNLAKDIFKIPYTAFHIPIPTSEGQYGFNAVSLPYPNNQFSLFPCPTLEISPADLLHTPIEAPLSMF